MNPIDKSGTDALRGLREIDVNKNVGGAQKKEKGQGVPFSELFGEALQQVPSAPKGVPELKFSAHAQTRMNSRGIELSPDEMVKLKEAVDRAGAKGSRESLILTDKAAFVVSVRNGTVITAVDRESMKENVFTNIDSTVMI